MLYDKNDENDHDFTNDNKDGYVNNDHKMRRNDVYVCDNNSDVEDNNDDQNQNSQNDNTDESTHEKNIHETDDESSDKNATILVYAYDYFLYNTAITSIFSSSIDTLF